MTDTTTPLIPTLDDIEKARVTIAGVARVTPMETSQFLAEVLTAHPRADLADVFTACVTDQAHRKPSTAARRLVDNGLAEKLRRNPLEHVNQDDGSAS